MLDLQIYTYGHVDSMFFILNGIAGLMQSSFGQTIMVTAAMISSAYYAMRIAYAGMSDYRIYLGKVIGMFAMMLFLLLPTSDVIVNDQISKKRDVISNLPLGFALPVGLYEAFGDLLTTGFEQAFTPVSNSSYRDYGMVFGARLVQEARSWRIRNPEFLENMRNFVDRCIVVEAMIGYHFTPQDLITSDDIWQLVSSTGVTMRKTALRSGKSYELVSCSEAANLLKPGFTTEIEELEKRYKDVDFGLAGAVRYVSRSFDRMNSNFKQNIEKSFKHYLGNQLGTSESAESIIRQQMMINAIKNYSDEYGYARASATQESNWRIAGDLAGTYIPILMTVLKGLVYASFTFLTPLLLISGGWRRYLGYLTLVASFQLWAPLNTILNMFIDLYSSNTLSGIADGVISFSTSSRIGNYTDKIVAVASGLQMAIPFLAFTLMQGGVNGFIHLAGTISGASQAAAAQAAHESVTGNKAFDNYSVGNQQLYNISGFKTDLNTSYASGQSSYQHLDGAIEKVMPGGNTLMQSGAGITESTGASIYGLEQNRHGQVNAGIQNSIAMQEHDMRSLTSAKSKNFTESADAISHIAQTEHSGQTVNYETLGEQGIAASKTVKQARELHDKQGYDWEQAASMALNASAGGTFGGKIPGTNIGAEVGVSAQGQIRNSNSSSQSVGETSSVGTDEGSTENYNNIVKALSNSSWSQENNLDTSYSDAVRESYEEVERAEKQLSISSQKVDDWHQAKSIIESEGASSRTENYQEVVDDIKKEYGVDLQTAHSWASKHSPEAERVWNNIQKRDHYVEDLVNKISRGRDAISGDNAAAKLDQFSHSQEQQIVKEMSGQVRQHAQNSGLDIDNVKNNVYSKKTDLAEKFVDMQGQNDSKYQDIKRQSELEEINRQSEISKLEKDRIGQGKFAKGAMETVNSLTGGTIGDRIGKPEKNSDKSKIIDTGIYEKGSNNRGN